MVQSSRYSGSSTHVARSMLQEMLLPSKLNIFCRETTTSSRVSFSTYPAVHGPLAVIQCPLSHSVTISRKKAGFQRVVAIEKENR